MSLSLAVFFCSQSKHDPIDTLVRYSHYAAVFQTEVLSFFTKTFPPLSPYYSLPSISLPFSLCSPFFPISGLGGSVTCFYPWASRAQPLTLAWSLTSTTKPRPQVKVCISDFLWNEPRNERACVHSALCLNCKEKFAVLFLRLSVVSRGVELPPNSIKGASLHVKHTMSSLLCILWISVSQ